MLNVGLSCGACSRGQWGHALRVAEFIRSILNAFCMIYPLRQCHPKCNAGRQERQQMPYASYQLCEQAQDQSLHTESARHTSSLGSASSGGSRGRRMNSKVLLGMSPSTCSRWRSTGDGEPGGARLSLTTTRPSPLMAPMTCAGHPSRVRSGAAVQIANG